MLTDASGIRIWVIWTQSQHSLHCCPASQIQAQASLEFHLYKFTLFLFKKIFPPGKKGKELPIKEADANIILIPSKNHPAEGSPNPGLPLET